MTIEVETIEVETMVGAESRPVAGTDLATDVTAAVLRFVLGTVLLGHALQKLGWFKGGGYPTSINGQADFLGIFGYDHTSLMAWLVTLTEAASGALLLTGLFTPLAVAGAMGITFQFIAGPQWSAGLFGDTSGAGGFEFTLIIFGAAAALGFIGAGRFSVDSRLPWSFRGVRWGCASIALAVALGTIVLVGFGVGLGGHPPALPQP
jgi:putative oxidoreductase